MLNKKWAREGRTAKQHKKWLANGGSKVVNKYGRQLIKRLILLMGLLFFSCEDDRTEEPLVESIVP